ncbi:tyrosine--tRNA ligase [candidate division KSB1 bacterium]|nr:MAG: tyrosine--tRNA ligase [candidate division KSB1 bacterium]
MGNVFDIFQERGFIQQTSDEDGIRKILKNEKVTCYIGFDPTADSFHIGSLVPIMALAYMQKYGHRVICVIGGGTAMIGDPSGKTEMRKMMTKKQIEKNSSGLKEQLSRFISFEEKKGIMVNNADWLLPLNYIEFLRDIGVHFSINRMLTFESYKIRLEKGLSFLEFNYMPLQAYDFYHLYKNFDCKLQMGGDDQWGNIVAGIELIRKKLRGNAYCITFPLITTSSGQKFGKTEKGTIWLDKNKTSPYDFYQYWINVDDRDVERFLNLFTFLPAKEVNRLGNLKGSDIREAKKILAYEVTKLTHGEKEAKNAVDASEKIFGRKEMKVSAESKVPTLNIPLSLIKKGIPAVELFHRTGLTASKSEAKRLIMQGGAYINQKRLSETDEIISEKDVVEKTIFLRKGKKKYFRIIVD